ncbi:Hypothetical predicted protein [Octopus vulgaris]|uniref:Uncharacterized protein n=1 Tax=Octopus vulgaris TaxID=6645 RepID=A0AA36B6J9_OCTVU|nr:Hypothetical predicted protein [Octopus vulgaris]
MADVEMATETEVTTVDGREYQRQRSNSDPQPAIEALNALNVQNALFSRRRWSPTMERRVLQSYLTLPPHRHLEPNRYGNLVATVVPIQRNKATNSSTETTKSQTLKKHHCIKPKGQVNFLKESCLFKTS